MWAEGNQERKLLQLASNEDLLKLEGYLEDKEAKVSLYEFLRNNITFASSLILGVDLAPMQHMMIKTFLNTDYSLAIISRGGAKSFCAGVYAALDCLLNPGIKVGILAPSFRQCLDPNSYLMTRSGLKQLKEISIGERVFAKNEFQTVLNKWNNQPSNGVKITTKKSYSINGKNGHRVLTFNPKYLNFEYKFINELRIGDVVPISIESNYSGCDLLTHFEFDPNANKRLKAPSEIKDSEEFYYFLGQMLGDGHFGKTKRNCKFQLSSGDSETLDYVGSFLENMFPDNSIRIKSAKDSNVKILAFNSLIMGKIFEHIGYKPNTVAINKEIPKKIFQAKKEYIASFIRGLMDSDGTVTIGGVREHYVEVTLATSSKLLAEQFQLLLLSFGIISKLGVEKERGQMEICGNSCFGREAYKVRITSYPNLKKYFDQIGFRLSRKQNKLKKYLESNIVKKDKLGIPGIADYLVNKYGLKIRRHKTTSKFKIKEYLKKFNKRIDEKDKIILRELSSDTFYFDSISSVEEVENIETIDIEVENEHCYWGNGFINHNSKQIFQYIEDISNKPQATLFKQAIGKISKGSDQWTMSIGESRIYCLPMGLGGKLRGFRFNRILVDEFLLMPESIFTEVIIPFLSTPEDAAEKQKIRTLEDKLIAKGEMEEKDRYFWPNNKLIALSSASYKFEFMYRYFQQLDYAIFQENQKSNVTRSIIQLNYECIPEQFYDRNLIEQAKLSMSQSQFDREFGALFTDDSSGYFKLSKMKNCCIPDGEKPTIEVKGEPGAEYILAFDPSWSQTESSDDFAIQILKVDKESKKSTLVHSYALSGEPLKVHIQYMLYCLDNFNIVAICGDYNGGVQFLQACNESDLFISRDLELRTIDTAFEDPEKYQQDLAQYKMKYNISEKRIVILRKPTSNWIRKANELLQANFDHKRIFFGARAIDQSYKQQISKSIPIESLKFVKSDEATNNQDKAAKMVDLVENQFDMIAKTIDQCALIQITSTAQGTQTFDLPPNLRKQTGPGKARKDSYSALVLGNWMAKIYYDSNSEQIQEVTRTFVPQFVA